MCILFYIYIYIYIYEMTFALYSKFNCRVLLDQTEQLHFELKVELDGNILLYKDN